MEKNGCSGKCLTALPLYRGRVLVSLKTEMDDPNASPGIGVETVSTFPIIEVIRFLKILYFFAVRVLFMHEKFRLLLW